MSRRIHNVSLTESGCHRRISDALEAAESGAIINVLPGSTTSRCISPCP